MLIPYAIETQIRQKPWVTYSLVGMNLIVFIILLAAGTEMREITFMQWGFIPDEWRRLSTFFTSMFLHGGWLHLIGNMYFLWLFGRALEDRIGPKRYLLLFFVTGFAACISHVFATPQFFSDVPAIGASGAISGVLGGFIVLAPYTRVKTFYVYLLFIRPLFGALELPSIVFIGGWFLMQLLYGFSTTGITGAVGVAYWAHIGGFLFGVLVCGGGRAFQLWKNSLHLRSLHRKFLKAVGFMSRERWEEAKDIFDGLSRELSGKLEILSAHVNLQLGNDEAARQLSYSALKSAVSAKDDADAVTAYYMFGRIGNVESLKTHDYLIVGRAFSKCGKIEQGRSLLAEGLRRFPHETESDLLLYELADSYVKVSENEQAVEIYSLFIKSYPQSKLYESAKYCLKELL